MSEKSHVLGAEEIIERKEPCVGHTRIFVKKFPVRAVIYRAKNKIFFAMPKLSKNKLIPTKKQLEIRKFRKIN